MGNPGDPGERDLTYDDLTPEEQELYNEPCCRHAAAAAYRHECGVGRAGRRDGANPG